MNPISVNWICFVILLHPLLSLPLCLTTSQISPDAPGSFISLCLQVSLEHACLRFPWGVLFRCLPGYAGRLFLQSIPNPSLILPLKLDVHQLLFCLCPKGFIWHFVEPHQVEELSEALSDEDLDVFGAGLCHPPGFWAIQQQRLSHWSLTAKILSL